MINDVTFFILFYDGMASAFSTQNSCMDNKETNLDQINNQHDWMLDTSFVHWSETSLIFFSFVSGFFLNSSFLNDASVYVCGSLLRLLFTHSLFLLSVFGTVG